MRTGAVAQSNVRKEMGKIRYILWDITWDVKLRNPALHDISERMTINGR